MPIPVPTLPAGDANIPAIGLGTSNLGGDGQRVSGETVATALKLGYRHIDTAWKYGSERDVGEGIRASGVPRSDIFLCTKVSHEYLRAADFARSVDESLANLGVDYVDLLLVHWPNAAIPLKEPMGALAKAKRDGLARHLGVANFNIALLDEAIALCPEPLVNLQGEGHPYIDTTRIVDACRARGIVFTAYTPLGRGCSTTRCWAKSRRAKAARLRRWRCAGSSSAAASRRSRARRTLGGSPKISTCSASRFRMTRWRASARSSGRTAASPIRRGGRPNGIDYHVGLMGVRDLLASRHGSQYP
jgi:diketogulonate reductase-like aldo/keto reductase